MVYLRWKNGKTKALPFLIYLKKVLIRDLANLIGSVAGTDQAAIAVYLAIFT